jgi:RNA polymerase-binding transcription factor DksA
VTTKKKIVVKKQTETGKAPRSATSAAILGHNSFKSGRKPGGPPKIKAEWAKYYENLLELRAQLMKQMSGLAKESAQEMAGYSLHMADSGTDNFDRDFALSLLSSDQDAIYEIEEALKRIEKDTYGVCELTGNRSPKPGWKPFPGHVLRFRHRLNWKKKAHYGSVASGHLEPLIAWVSLKQKTPKKNQMTSQPKKKNNLWPEKQ